MSNKNCKGVYESKGNENSGGLHYSDKNIGSSGVSWSTLNKGSTGVYKSDRNDNCSGVSKSHFNIDGTGLYMCYFTKDQGGKSFMFFDAQLTEGEIVEVINNISYKNRKLTEESIEYIKNRPEFIKERFEEATGITLDDCSDCRHGKYDSPCCPDCGEELK
jgi:hypothetical protein